MAGNTMRTAIICNICLDELTSAVSIPCGHLHCDKCLRQHIANSSSAYKSSCPTCRASFPIVSLDLAHVPGKYHDFLYPSVRKVYLNTLPAEDPHAKVASLEARIVKLKHDNVLLMDRAESAQRAAIIHAEGEKTARLDAEQLKRGIAEEQRKYVVLKSKYDDLARQNSDIRINRWREDVVVKRKRASSPNPDVEQELERARAYSAPSFPSDHSSGRTLDSPLVLGSPLDYRTPGRLQKRPRLSAPAASYWRVDRL